MWKNKIRNKIKKAIFAKTTWEFSIKLAYWFDYPCIQISFEVKFF